MEKGIEGTVVVEATLDADGMVSDARVLSGPQELRKAALESVLQWHFTHDAAGSTRQVGIAFQLPAEGALTSGVGFGIQGGIQGGVTGGVTGGVGGAPNRAEKLAAEQQARAGRQLLEEQLREAGGYTAGDRERAVEPVERPDARSASRGGGSSGCAQAGGRTGCAPQPAARGAIGAGASAGEAPGRGGERARNAGRRCIRHGRTTEFPSGRLGKASGGISERDAQRGRRIRFGRSTKFPSGRHG